MKTKIFLLLFVLALGFKSYSQESIINEIDNGLLTKYISLALNHYPLKRASDASVERAKAQIYVATMSVLDVFQAGYFYSPQRNSGLIILPGAGTGGSNNIVTSGFQLGVNVNLGQIFSKPGLIKAAKADYTVAKAQNDDFRITLISNVRSRYYEYLAAKKQLELSNLASRDLRSILANAQAQFQNGTITIDVYTNAKNASITADAATLNAEVAFLKAKNALEDMIGKKLETVQ